MFNDFNQWGIGYANTAVFIPEKMATVKDIKTDSIVTSPPISVLFKKDKYGRDRDENYMTSDGGAALRQNGVCDYFFYFLHNYLIRYTTFAFCTSIKYRVYRCKALDFFALKLYH